MVILCKICKDTGNRGLKLLQADWAWYYSSVSAPLPVDTTKRENESEKEKKAIAQENWRPKLSVGVSQDDYLIQFYLHFDVTWLFVVAEGTGKLRLQITRHLLLRRGLSFGFAATHCTQIEAGLWVCLTDKTRPIRQGEGALWWQNTWTQREGKQIRWVNCCTMWQETSVSMLILACLLLNSSVI